MSCIPNELYAVPCNGRRSLQMKSNAESALVVATRGKCTFTEKARNVQAASASSLLIVNNEEGNVHPPGPDGKDLGERRSQSWFGVVRNNMIH